MTYNVFSGTLNPTQSINQSMLHRYPSMRSSSASRTWNATMRSSPTCWMVRPSWTFWRMRFVGFHLCLVLAPIEIISSNFKSCIQCFDAVGWFIVWTVAGLTGSIHNGSQNSSVSGFDIIWIHIKRKPICMALVISCSSLGAQVWHVLTRDYTATHTFIHNWNVP